MTRSDDAPLLAPGIYEALLTRRLRERLPGGEGLVRTDIVELADAPSVLAHHVSGVIELLLRSPDMDGDLERQVDLCNRLIAELAKDPAVSAIASGETVDQNGRELVEVLRSSDSPLAAVRPLPRPTTRLDQNALFVSAKQEPALASELYRELESADRVDLLCAFLVWSGVRVLLDPLKRARKRGVPIRVITTTYTGITDARALDELEKLGAEIKVSYDTGVTRLHAKAWLFERESEFSTAYIGSSNLTHTALHDGLEWNVRLTQSLSRDLLARFRAAFETYWADPGFETYQQDTFRAAIERERRRSESDLLPFDIQPYPFQREMLYGLDVERKRHDQWKNLMVAATGTGKTVVSAFDFKRLREEFGDLSLLFVAHRREILKQSRSTFRNVLREASFGELMVGDDRPVEGRHVFASIQSLHSKDVSKWAPDAFDVVIVDEFHHAEAKTYRKLLEHVQPRVLLGMTATPERTDGLDVKHWFNGRIAVELRLWDALEQGLLCPFQYFGVADDIDLSSLAWSRGGYEASELERLYTGNDVRLRKVLKAVDDIVEDSLQMRALGFCVSVAHARYMAERFNAAGIPSRAVTGQTNADDRKGALKLLERGEINVIFCVDLFNEGLDIPDVDTVLFLRPTESAVVFLQQLGRGLRRTDGKSGLTVLDFIGQQHRRFRYLDRFQALIGGNRRRIREQVEEGFPFLPAGCSIALDRQSEEIILANLKSSVSRVKSELVRELESIGDVSLSDFLDRTGHDLEDVYSGSKPGWTALRREAGFVHDADPEESLLEKALGRMLHIDDPLRVGAYSQGLVLATSLEWPTRDEREIRLWNMLHFDLWGADLSSTDLDSSMARLWRNPDVKDELRQLLVLSARSARHLALEARLEADIPLSLHARYTRNEILAALGVASPERNPSWREGVKHIDRYDIDLLLVTLKKSDKRFSPSTMYRDYPISPSLFHWESQSTTSVASKTGQRYINHVRLGARILLFVREDAVGDALGASPFVFLGPVNYARHQGDRPIAITWELAHEMPPDFFEAAKAAV